jgi:ATP-dependent RNA helicase RhlE
MAPTKRPLWSAAARERTTFIVTFHTSRRRRRFAANRTPSPTRAPATASPPLVTPVATPGPSAATEASPFTALGLSAPLVRAVLDERYLQPSPVQTEVIPLVLAGRDVLACAQTGTGKTASFVLPILQRLAAEGPSSGRIRALILTPTRELAAQIAERVSVYGRYLPLRHALVYGGVSQRRQEVALRAGPDILVATPGRLLDLMQQKLVGLDAVNHFVLDEADRMLDMGFVQDVRRIGAALRARRQTLLFSATIAPEIESLAQRMLVDAARVSITPAVTTPATVEQSVVFVDRADKPALLERVLRDGATERTLVFTRTKHGANRLSERLDRAGFRSAAIHGNKTQGARERALDSFRRGTTHVLVATDVAARGIDVDDIALVVNFDLPSVAECYVHRIGRTGRAGASGRAISFCDRDEQSLLRDVERLIRRRLPAGNDSPARVVDPGTTSELDREKPSATPRPRPVESDRRPRSRTVYSRPR